jgi:hypothetical protein
MRRGNLPSEDRIFTFRLEGATVAWFASCVVDIPAEIHIDAVVTQLGSDYLAIRIRCRRVPSGSACNRRGQCRRRTHIVAHAHAAIGKIQVRNAERRNAWNPALRAARQWRYARAVRRYPALHHLQLLRLCHLCQQRIGPLICRFRCRRGLQCRCISTCGRRKSSARRQHTGQRNRQCSRITRSYSGKTLPFRLASRSAFGTAEKHARRILLPRQSMLLTESNCRAAGI